MRPIRVKINLNALRANLGMIKQRAAGARIWAVVKADAYGHGLARVQAALDAADGLAMLELEAAIGVRERGWSKPLLLLEGFFSADEIELYVRYRCTAVVHNDEQIKMIDSARPVAPIDVYLKLNSGMNRLGFPVAAARGALERLRASGKVAVITLMTHYTNADGLGVAEQLEVFENLAKELALPKSSANSAALLRFGRTHGAWVRPGIVLYGCSPFQDESAQEIGVSPVMTMTSRIIAEQVLERGARVGYSGLFVAPHKMRIGVVACGYADGYPRHAPGGTPILVDSVRTQTIGRVSMDMLFVDLSNMPNSGVGSEVTLWGDGLAADEVATSAGTISYELLCALSQRVPVSVSG